jgi:hypothetical protein
MERFSNAVGKLVHEPGDFNIAEELQVAARFIRHMYISENSTQVLLESASLRTHRCTLVRRTAQEYIGDNCRQDR